MKRMFPGWMAGSTRGDVRFDPGKILLTVQDEKAIDEGCYFEIPAAERVIRFFEKYLRHSKGKWGGKPFRLLDWQKYELLGPLFGWKRPDGTRRFRIGYIEIPKKNGKSTISSGITLYLLMADGEPGAEVYSAAADRDQASIIFNESKHMVQKSKALSRRLRVVDSRKTIVFPATESVYRALSADVPTKEGLNIHGLVFDELHAQKSRTLWDTLRYGGAARTQPLLLSITTAGFDRQSICWEQHEYARKVLKGTVQDTAFFALVYSTNWEEAESRNATAEEIPWTDRRAWFMANPSLGATISEDDFSREVQEAMESPAKQNTFKRYRLNIWTRSETRWIPPEVWNRCAGGVLVEGLKGRKAFGGLDLSSTTDLTSFSLVFEPDGDGVADVLSLSWCPEDTLGQRVRTDRVPYDLWAEQGYLIPTPGNVVDYDFILEKICSLRDEHNIRLVGFDRWGAAQITAKLEERGIDVVPVGQGFRDMSPATKEFERMVLSRKIRHGGNPLLAWAMDNVVIVSDPAENIKPSKEKSTERIDPAVSVVIAMAAMAKEAEHAKPDSVYLTRGLAAL